MGGRTKLDVTLLYTANRKNAWILSDKVLCFILVYLKDEGSRLNQSGDMYIIPHASDIKVEPMFKVSCHNNLQLTNELP